MKAGRLSLNTIVTRFKLFNKKSLVVSPGFFFTKDRKMKAIYGALQVDPFASNSTLCKEYKNKKLGLVIADDDAAVLKATQKKILNKNGNP